MRAGQWLSIIVFVTCAGCEPTNTAECGDGIVEPGEDCDGNSVTCAEAGFAGSGTVTCSPQCTFETATCDDPLCGNGVVDPGEECETDATCESLNAGTGTATCITTSCRYDLAGCTHPGTVTIIVTVNDQPRADAPVAIADANGVNIASVQTDATGKVIHAIGADHVVTAAYTHSSGGKQLRTAADVDPGDTVVLAFFDSGSTPVTTAGTVSTTFPTPLPTATTHKTTNGCLSQTSSVSSTSPHNLNAFTFCLDAEGEAQRFAETLDGVGTPLGYDYVENVPLTMGTPTSTPVTAWSQSYTDLRCELANAPAVGDVTFLFDGTFGLIRYAAGAKLLIAPTAGQTYTHVRPMPNASFVDEVSCVLQLPDSRQCSQSAATPGLLSFNGNDFTTALTSVVIDRADPNRPALIATEGTAGALADFTSGTMFFAKNGGGGSLIWGLFGPGNATTLRVPELPNDQRFASYLLTGFTQQVSSTNVGRTDTGGLADYKAAKAAGFVGMGKRCSSFCFAH